MRHFEELLREAVITALYTMLHLSDKQKDIIMGCLLIGVGFILLMPYRAYAGPHLRYSLRGVVHAEYGLRFIGGCTIVGLAVELYGVVRFARGLFM